AALGRRRGLNLAPLASLYAYVLWPRLDPALAKAAALVAATALVAVNVERGRNFRLHSLVDLLVFVASFALYLHTLAPTVLPADSGEFQLISYVLGIAHPPGYPLYTMLGRLFTLLPLGDPARRVNLMSALFAALTLALVSRTVRRASPKFGALGGVAAAASLAGATTFWAQATTANVRSLSALLTALCLFLLVSYAQKARAKRASPSLTPFALAFGLGMTHHGSLVFLGLAFAAFLLATKASLLACWRSLLRPLLAFALSFAVLLYIPLRAPSAPFGGEHVVGLRGFLDHVLARGFRGDMFAFARPRLLPERLLVLAGILDFEFGPALLVAALVGALMALREDWRFLLLCGGSFAVQAFVAITYRAPQTVEYLMPAYVAVALLIGYGAEALSRYRSPGAIAACLVLLLGLGQLARNYPSFADLAGDLSTRRYAEAVLESAPPDAVVLSNWHWATALWYLQQVEGMRPDVEVRYVYPEEVEYAQTWRRRIEENIGERPLIVTNYYRDFEALPYRFVPLGEAFLVRDKPLFAAPEDIRPLDVVFGGRIRILGYRLISSDRPLVLALYWQPVAKLDRDYSFFVHLVDGEGRVWGQMDVTHQATHYEVGEVLSDRYEIAVLPTAPPGRYELVAGVYFTTPEGGWRRLTTEAGDDAVSLTEVRVEARTAPPVTLHPLYQPFEGGPTLVGFDADESLPGTRRVYLHWRWPGSAAGDYEVLLYAGDELVARSPLPRAPAGAYLTTAHDLPPMAMPLELELRSAGGAVCPPLGPWRLPWRGRLPLPAPRGRYVDLGGEMLLVGVKYRGAVRPGEKLRVELRFLSQRPLVRDYVVSVRLMDEGGRWRAQDDSVPALGAIPTLKWIRGSRVADRHTLEVPPDAQEGAADLSLIAYDAFTQRPLAILDERLARLGPAVPLGRAGVKPQS
ncbi:MAG TPA: DUF2723 domain-containing protein, partial [Anaerolineae bacterium]|nr:DUF2723 domain-containing protein [Anaerolineae bacterium]